MQLDPNHVDWGSWLRSRPGDIRNPSRVIVPLGGGWWCQLCSSRVAGPKAEHHVAHMLDLDAYQAGEREGPKPDSVRRSEARRHDRQAAVDRAAALGEDPFLYAVDRVEPTTQHRIKRRRLRHPRQETEARIAAELEAGLTVAAIADKTTLTEDYVNRVVRRVKGGR